MNSSINSTTKHSPLAVSAVARESAREERVRAPWESFMRAILGAVLGLGICASNATASEIEGVWQTVSDKDGRPDSIVRIERKGAEFVGTVEKLLRPLRPNPTCEKCPGDFANKPIEGLRFIWGLQSKTPGEYDAGSILDPSSGSIYRLKVSLSPDGSVLTIRGYLGISLFGRSQSWQRLAAQR